MSWSMRKPTRIDDAFGPPLLPEETKGSLSELEKRLNRDMKCTAGKNQVYIRSLLTNGATTPPRIALKCPLRRDIKLPADVFYEHIRDVCCTDPKTCPAWLNFEQRHIET